MGQPHKHAAVIKAWADGETIEVQIGEDWQKVINPLFLIDAIYRVKPKNIVVHRRVAFNTTTELTQTFYSSDPNIEYTFDPDGKLLDAKVLK